MPQPEVRMLATTVLRPCEVNPRFAVGDVSELAASIEALGVLVPLLVTPRGKGYLVVAGHRRLAACKQIGLDEVPAIIREMTDLERMEMMLVENQQRVPLSAVEEGIAYARIMKQHGITQKALGVHIGKSQYYVGTRLAVIKLPKHVVEQVHKGELPVEVALGYTYHRRTKSYVAGSKLSPCHVERHATHTEACEVRSLAERRLALVKGA